jgi:uncharacterized protein (TIGR02757 family)
LNGLYELLEEKYQQYNRPEFIETDPVCIPHMFSKKENIELAGFLTATIAWGQRATIIQNARKLMNLLDNDPINYITSASEAEIGRLKFCHRTFNAIDLQFFVKALKNIYLNHGGLEMIFTSHFLESLDMKNALSSFRKVFFELEKGTRTGKHIADITKDASAKRLNLFLRWMVRNDNRGVDFGLWSKIPSSALYIPLDIHSGNMARRLGLLNRKPNDWTAVELLTDRLRKYDPEDPVKYDFALFGMGVFENL